MDSRRGPKPVIVWSIVVLIVVCSLIVGMDREQIWGVPLDSASSKPDIIFFICGALIGGASLEIDSMCALIHASVNIQGK
jgi:UMF1 family MFS transporter